MNAVTSDVVGGIGELLTKTLEGDPKTFIPPGKNMRPGGGVGVGIGALVGALGGVGVAVGPGVAVGEAEQDPTDQAQLDPLHKPSSEPEDVPCLH